MKAEEVPVGANNAVVTRINMQALTMTGERGKGILVGALLGEASVEMHDPMGHVTRRFRVILTEDDIRALLALCPGLIERAEQAFRDEKAPGVLEDTWR